MTLLELRHWIRFSSTTLLLFIIGALGHAHSQSSQNPDLQQLKDQVRHLNEEMKELSEQIEAAEHAQQGPGTQPGAASVSTPTEGQPQTVPMDGEVTGKKNSIDVYGFVMLDSGYEFKQQDPIWFDVMRPTKLPSFKGEFAPDGNVFAGVRQSRFGVKSSTPTSFGDLNTIFEFELFGTGVDAGQTTFRLRHAYGELGQFGAGQTWSTFMDIDVFPNSLE